MVGRGRLSEIIADNGDGVAPWPLLPVLGIKISQDHNSTASCQCRSSRILLYAFSNKCATSERPKKCNASIFDLKLRLWNALPILEEHINLKTSWQMYWLCLEWGRERAGAGCRGPSCERLWCIDLGCRGADPLPPPMSLCQAQQPAYLSPPITSGQDFFKVIKATTMRRCNLFFQFGWWVISDDLDQSKGPE